MDARQYDVAVVGGGVIGLAVARAVAHTGASCVVVEARDSCIDGASGHNSGIICTGYDAHADSLEFKLLRRGVPLLMQYLRDKCLPHNPCGSLVIAHKEEELPRLSQIVHENHAIGDSTVTRLSREETLALEPALPPSVLGSVFIPGETVVDPWLIPASYQLDAVTAGAVIKTNFCVASVSRSSDAHQIVWTLADKTGKQSVTARVVVNAAGVFAERMERVRISSGYHSLSERSNGPSFTSKPRLGQYLVLSPRTPCLTRPIQPIPTDVTKGVFVYCTLYGHIVVGPTSEETTVHDGALPDPHTRKTLVEHAVKTLPSLSDARIVGEWVGIRPGTDKRDYCVRLLQTVCALPPKYRLCDQIDEPHPAWITVAGIRSTGLSASMGIAEYVLHSFIVQHTQGSLDRPRPIRWQVLPSSHPGYDPVCVAASHAGDDPAQALSLTVTHPISVLGLMPSKL